MVKTYKKGDRTYLQPHFQACEFDCQGGDCNETLIDDELTATLEKIRTGLNDRTFISSGYRCAHHNAEVGGASQSYHMKGMAADIYMEKTKPATIAKFAESIGVRGIGLYDNFVHIDVRPNKYYWNNNASTGHKETGTTTFGVYTGPVNTVVNNNNSELKNLFAKLKSLINEIEKLI